MLLFFNCLFPSSFHVFLAGRCGPRSRSPVTMAATDQARSSVLRRAPRDVVMCREGASATAVVVSYDDLGLRGGPPQFPR